MLPDETLPASLSALLAVFAPCFTARSFRTSGALACGFLGQTGKRTVCGMRTGAGLSRIWPHDRAYSSFSRARWDPGDLGLAAARLAVAVLVPAGQPVTVAIDDTLFRRRGKKIWAASWFHDGSAPGPAKTGYGNNRVVAAIAVTLPFLPRPVPCRCSRSSWSRAPPPSPGCGWPARWPACWLTRCPAATAVSRLAAGSGRS
jgi:DDE superfamily endonuclease